MLAHTGHGSWQPRDDAHLWLAFNLRAHHTQAQTVARRVEETRMASALAGSPDEDKMRRLRETLLAYVTVWGAGVDSYSLRIRSSFRRLDDRVTDADWRAMALTGMDAAAAEETVQAVAQGNRDAAQVLAVLNGNLRALTGRGHRVRHRATRRAEPASLTPGTGHCHCSSRFARWRCNP